MVIKGFFGKVCLECGFISREGHEYLVRIKQMIKEYMLNLKENEGCWDDELESIWDNL